MGVDLWKLSPGSGRETPSTPSIPRHVRLRRTYCSPTPPPRPVVFPYK